MVASANTMNDDDDKKSKRGRSPEPTEEERNQTAADDSEFGKSSCNVSDQLFDSDTPLSNHRPSLSELMICAR